jgi:hypothetical protein
VGEFDDLDPAEFAKSVDQQRARLQQEQAETAIKEQEAAKRRMAEEANSLTLAEERTSELFAYLTKAFKDRKTSDNHALVVERTGSRPEVGGYSRLDEKPAWIVIRAAAGSSNPRHRPTSYSVLEYVLAARCSIKSKYELIIYPTLRQDQPGNFATDDRDEFMKRIQDEIAGR